ncbi:MAG: hypothetical protein ACW99A_14630, partial [Candidatus Kariarchaeaceae archaeon]
MKVVNNVNINDYASTELVNSSLILDWTFTDIDFDSERDLNITWYKFDLSTWIYQSVWDNLSVIDAVDLTKGETWRASINIYDGEQWSLVQSSQIIIVINSLPLVSGLTFINTEYHPFFVEDELIEISYFYSDNDRLDIDQSIIMWYIDGVHNPDYDDLTIIQFSETHVG